MTRISTLFLFFYFFIFSLASGDTLDTLKDRIWTDTQLVILKSLSISHLQSGRDSSNKVVNNPQAVLLGKRLFHDPAISNNKQISCSSCHIETNAFSDNKVIAKGTKKGFRNTPTLFNADQQDWYFWDGRADSAWAQALVSIESPAEHNFTRTELVHFISQEKSYREEYQSVFNKVLPSIDELSDYPQISGPNGTLLALKSWKSLTSLQRKKINTVFSNIGKAIAAYVYTIRSTPTRFDMFIAQLSDNADSSLFTKSEKRGLKLFLSSQVGCLNCHSGAVFSNKSFHNIGTGITGKDNGRSEIVDLIIHNPFNCLSQYSDAKKNQCSELNYLNRNGHELAGSFKTPTLRGISKTAPYMHDGRYKNLEAVLDHYSNIDKQKALMTDLPILRLSKQDQQDIISFLLTL